MRSNLDRRLDVLEEAIPVEKEYIHIPNEAYARNPFYWFRRFMIEFTGPGCVRHCDDVSWPTREDLIEEDIAWINENIHAGSIEILLTPLETNMCIEYLQSGACYVCARDWRQGFVWICDDSQSNKPLNSALNAALFAWHRQTGVERPRTIDGCIELLQSWRESSYSENTDEYITSWNDDDPAGQWIEKR